METSSLWKHVHGVQRPQEFEVLVRPEGAQHETATLDGIPEGLRLYSTIPYRECECGGRCLKKEGDPCFHHDGQPDEVNRRIPRSEHERGSSTRNIMFRDGYSVERLDRR